MSGNSSKNQCRRQEAVMQLKNSSPFLLSFKMLSALRAAKGEICHGSLLILFVSQFWEASKSEITKRGASLIYTPPHAYHSTNRNTDQEMHRAKTRHNSSVFRLIRLIYKVVVCEGSLKNCTFRTLFLSYRTVYLHVYLAFFLVRIMCDSRNIKWIS